MMTGSPFGAESLHGIDQRIGLAPAAAFEQAQVHDIAMHVAGRRFQHAVQDAALLVGVVGDVVVAACSRSGSADSSALPWWPWSYTAFMP